MMKKLQEVSGSKRRESPQDFYLAYIAWLKKIGKYWMKQNERPTAKEFAQLRQKGEA